MVHQAQKLPGDHGRSPALTEIEMAVPLIGDLPGNNARDWSLSQSGHGPQVMIALREQDGTAPCAPHGQHVPERTATSHGPVVIIH